MPHVTRRTVLKMSAGAALAADLLPGVLAAEDAQRPDLRLAVINDTHYNDEKCDPYFAALVKKLNASDVDLVLIVGDLVQAGTRKQFTAIRDILSGLKAPLKTVPGNHDFRNDVNPKDPEGPRLNVDRTTYDKAFPDMANYTFELKGWQFVALDTCDGVLWHGVSCGKAPLKFLDATLPEINKKKPLVLLTHFPLATQDKVGYPTNRLVNAEDVLGRFKEHNLRAIFNGHHHGLTERAWRGVPVTTSPCCSFYIGNHDKTPAKGYFLVTARDGQLTREFVDFTPDKVLAK